MALSRAAGEELTETMECPICFDVYQNPKQLPCNHTFCLKCIKEHCQTSAQGVTKSCPLCRGEFCVPEGIAENLPNNDSIAKLVLEKKLRAEKKSKAICRLCSELDD